MNVLVCLTLTLLLATQPAPRPAASHKAHWHWCQQPTRTLRWLNRLIQNAQSWPPYHYGWEVHQARYQGKEVFIVHLCRSCGQQRGFLLYNHYGDLIEQGEGADSVRLVNTTQDRLLAFNPGRMSKQR